MTFLIGVHLLPSTGEFTYDTVAYLARRITEGALGPINTYYAPGGPKTDYSFAIDQLQVAHPECTTVSLVCAWFCDGIVAGSNYVYPSTTYIGGSFQPSIGGADEWRVSGLNQGSSGLIAIPTSSSGQFIYGGTPSDQSIVRCIRDLKIRGFKVVFYPFLLMTSSGRPWRGEITYAPDLASAATSAMTAFLGTATTSDFTPDSTNLTVAYSGSPTDYTYRRMILHYAWLMTVAGGVNVFALGSELRGLESVRGPAWTKAGTTDGGGHAVWDYPFVAGLVQLAADVRSILDGAGFPKGLSTLTNLITYSADWSVWMGFQHPGENGQWPHLDSLYASSNIDFVSFDNYLPLSDWVTGEQGLDEIYWQSPAPTTWPPASNALNGLALSGAPTIYSKPYLKANIEGGEKFNWYYANSTNAGAGFDPNGSGLIVSRPEGDRLAQTRQPYYANQQLLANKQLRWWWNNSHQAVYDAGSGWAPQGPATQWVANSKPMIFLEYGIPAVDKGANQPNLFYAPSSIASGTPYWSIWQPVPGGGLLPQPDDTIAGLGLQAIYEYWNTDGHNATSGGVVMLQFAFCCVWNWDARPFPAFPLLSSVWGDAPNWPFGNWANGRGPTLPPVAPSADPTPAAYPTFPSLSAQGWSVHVKPRFATALIGHISGRETRRATSERPVYEIELTYDLLDADAAQLELRAIAGFFAEQQGQNAPFWIAPPGLSTVAGQVLGNGNGSTTTFVLVRAFGAYTEPVAATAGVTAVYLNGVPLGSGWSVSSGYGPTITFTAAPGAGVVVTADYGLLWLCRFAEDVADLENFMSLLWNWRTIKLQMVRP